MVDPGRRRITRGRLGFTTSRYPGFARLGPSVGFVVALAASMVLLSFAVRTIPVGTAYAVWVGIGAVGASIAGAAIYRDTMTVAQMAALALLVSGIVAVRLTRTQ